jgi:nitroreductase
MNLNELLVENRSYRRFCEDEPIPRDTLVALVANSRLCPFSGNRQPLKYLLSCTPERNAAIFPHLQWAAAMPDWSGPAEGERPAGYILMLGDLEIAPTFNIDSGIAAQTILLSAVDRGLGGCMIGSCHRDALHDILRIPSRFVVVMVIALGRPRETVVLDELQPGDDIAYWRDGQGVHHVPKRPLDELLVEFES